MTIGNRDHEIVEVGVLALSWALEVGEVSRFPSIAKAVSYCGPFCWLRSFQHRQLEGISHGEKSWESDLPC